MSTISDTRHVPTRAIILDSNLEINEGHDDHFVRHARRDLAAHGLEVVVYGSLRVAPTLAEELQVLPGFSKRAYDSVSEDTYDGLLADAFRGADLFAEEAHKCLSSCVRAGDLVILPTATIAELAGLTRLALQWPPTFRLAALFHRTGVGSFRQAGPGSLTGALLRNLGRSLSVFDPAGLWIGGLTEVLCETLSAALARPVHHAASPNWYAAMRPHFRSSLPRVGFLGHLRLEKACLNLPHLTAAVAAVAPDAVCLIAGHHDRGTPDFAPLRSLAANGVDVRLGWQGEEAFADLIAGCDLVVLPYDREVYGEVLSGIFCHAVAHGKPTIVPEGTWMAHQIALGKATGLTFRGNGLAEVAATIKRGLDLIEPLQAQASTRVQDWRRRECGAKLLDDLLTSGFKAQR